MPPRLPAVPTHTHCRCVTMNQVKGIFGFTTDDYIGKIAFPAIQVGHGGGVWGQVLGASLYSGPQLSCMSVGGGAHHESVPAALLLRCTIL